MNPSAVPDSGMFDILNTKRECDDNDEHKDAVTVDDNINSANLDTYGNINPPNIIDSMKMKSPSDTEGMEAWLLHKK